MKYTAYAMLNNDSDFNEFRSSHGHGVSGFFKSNAKEKLRFLQELAKEGKPRFASLDAPPWERYTTHRILGNVIVAYDAASGRAALFKAPEALSNRRVAARYADIIFLQNSQDFSDFRGSGGRGVAGFFDSDEEEMMEYLMQWDTGEYHEVRSQKPWGSHDDTYQDGKYIMSYNSRHGYAGLCKKV